MYIAKEPQGGVLGGFPVTGPLCGDGVRGKIGEVPACGMGEIELGIAQPYEIVRGVALNGGGSGYCGVRLRLRVLRGMKGSA